MYDIGKPMTRRWSKQNVDVVGHHDPTVKAIPLPVEMEHRVLYHLRDAKFAKPGLSRASVEVCFDPLVKCNVLELPETNLFLPDKELFLRQTIGETESHELREFSTVEMRWMFLPTTIPPLDGPTRGTGILPV